MRKDRFAEMMGLGHDRLGQVERHRQDAIGLDGICKNLNAVRAVTNLLAHSPCTLRGGFDLGNADVIGFEESPDVNGRSPLAPERLPDGKNPWSLYFAAFDAAPDDSRVFQNRCDVKNRCETPACEHF